MYEKKLGVEIGKGTITKENAAKVQKCVEQKEFANIDAGKPMGDMQAQIIECLKEINQNKYELG